MEKFSHPLLAYFRRLSFNIQSDSLSNQVYTCHIEILFLIHPAAPAIFEAECATSETHRWVARDGPSVRGARADRAAGGRENTVQPRSCPSARARNLQ